MTLNWILYKELQNFGFVCKKWIWKKLDGGGRGAVNLQSLAPWAEILQLKIVKTYKTAIYSKFICYLQTPVFGCNK